MPQLDLTTFASQIFWLAITFGVLYLIMARFSLPIVREVLQNRQVRISGDLKKASSLKEEAESTEADFTSSINQARHKAANMLSEARSRVAKEEAKRNAKLDETIAKQLAEADVRVKELKQTTLDDLLDVSADIVVEVIKKVSDIDVKADDAKKIIAENTAKANQ